MMLPFALLLGVSTNIVQLKYLLVKIDINDNAEYNESMSPEMNDITQKSTYRSLVGPAEKVSERK